MKSIQAVAKLTDLTVPTLRYYDRLGLLPNLIRNQNGYRQFSDRDVSDVNLVKCFREVGVPIKQIKKIVVSTDLNQETVEQRLKVLKEQQATLRMQRRQIDISLLALQVKTARYEAVLTDPNRVDHGETELVQYFVKYARPDQQQHVTKRLTALFEQTKPAILKDTYTELKDCFQPEYLAEAQAAFALLTGLQY